MRDNSNVKGCTTRAGNVIGGGDWALNRIVPDCFRSWSKQGIIKDVIHSLPGLGNMY